MRSFPDFRRRAPRPHDHRGVVRASNRGNSKLRCYIRRDPPFIRTASFSSKPWGEELDSVRLRPAPSSRVEKRSGAQPHAAWVPAETSEDGRWPDGAPGGSRRLTLEVVRRSRGRWRQIVGISPSHLSVSFCSHAAKIVPVGTYSSLTTRLVRRRMISLPVVFPDDASAGHARPGGRRFYRFTEVQRGKNYR
jgi:hypothetical protein